MMRTTEGEDGVSDLNIEIDRISELPDSIIHLIFGLMRSTKEVVRTQLLSKNWKRLFDSYQTFDFDESLFRVDSKASPRYLERRRNEERFKEYIEKSLATRLDRLECADKFRLHTKGFPDTQCLARCIRTAIAKNVKELDVDLWGLPVCSDVPIDLTQSSSITSLKIRGEPLHRLAAMKMCNLREISIKFVQLFDVNAMKKLEENCPLLEDLRLVYCRNLLHLQISSLNKLKRVVVEFCCRVEYIKIASPNLETFELHDNRLFRRPDLKCWRNLRNLSFIKSYHMSDSAFEDCISMFPLLEKLELDECTGIKKPKICSLTLKFLALFDCLYLDKVEVDAPVLHSFRYIGRAMPLSFVNAPRLSEATFNLLNSCRRRWDAKHENFFSNLDGSKGFKLLVYTKQNMKIVEDPREEDLYQTKECMIELTKSSLKVVERFEDWLRDCRAKSLVVVVVSSIGELLKSINKLIIEREEKCPRRHFKGVKISTLENVEKTSHVFRWRYRKTKSSSRKKLSLFEKEDRIEKKQVQYHCH